jgi:ParB-like chromosome segregation protein Spo0J
MELKRVRLDSINFGQRFRKDYGDIDSLARSIKERGLFNPPVVTNHPKHGYILLAGGRRIRAVKKLGWSMVHVHFLDLPEYLDQLLVERDENKEQKPFTPSEGVALGKEIEKAFGERRGRPSDDEIPANDGNFGKESADIAAEAAGFSSTTQYRRAKEVVEHGSAEIIAAMDAGEIKVSAAAKHVKELRAAIKTRTKKKGKGKPPKTPLLVNVFNDTSVDKALEKLTLLIEARGRAFGESPGLRSCLLKLEEFAVVWYDWAGKPTPENEIIPEVLDTPKFREEWSDWKKHRKEKKNPLTPISRERQLRELEEMGLERALAALSWTMKQGYTGIFEKEKHKDKPTESAALRAAMGL